MREDLDRLEDRLREANEQVIDHKLQLGRAKEASVTLSGARATSSGQTGGVQVQPMQEDPAVARLQLGMDTPYFGSALQVETRREREFLGDSLTQNVISGKAVLLIGTRITPEDVEKFVVQKRVQLRSGGVSVGTIGCRHRRERDGHDRVEARE